MVRRSARRLPQRGQGRRRLVQPDADLQRHTGTKEYAVYAIDSLGTALLAHGQASGDTWTFTTSQPAFNIRLTLKMARDAYTAVAEYSGLDGKYLPLSEVRATRTK